MSEINMALLNDFIDEAREHLDEMESLLLQLGEADVDTLDILNNIFRTVHNIKGGSQLTGLVKISTLAHRLEDLLDLLRNGKMQSNEAIVETLIHGRDRIVTLVNELEQVQQETSDVDDLVDQLTAWIEDGVPAAPAVSPQQEQAPSELPQPVSTPKPLPNAQPRTTEYDYREEHDKELFGIFKKHLGNNFSSILTQLSQLAGTPDQNAVLVTIRDVLKSMHSSANYMGYQALCNLYDDWQLQAEELQKRVSSGTVLGPDCMDALITRLVAIFPELTSLQAELPVSQAETIGSQDTPVDDTDDDITASVMAAFDAESDDDSEEAILPAPSVTVANVALFDDFIEEATNYLDDLEGLLIKLENTPSDTELLNEVFRNIHNIKGGAQLTGLDKISRLSLRLEDVLDLLRNHKKVSTASIVHTMIEVRDRLLQLVHELETSQAEVSGVDDLITQLTTFIENTEQGAPPPSANTATEHGLTSSYYEENDKELFNIFVDHLTEQLAFIAAEARIMQQEPVAVERLAVCGNAVHRLWSSANYMGYDELTSFYGKWMSVIDQVKQIINQGETVSLDFMEHYLDELVEIFPQVREARVLAASQLPSRVAEPDLPAESDDQESPQSTIATIDLQRPEDVESLFNRLNNALELSMKGGTGSDADALHDVYDELVTPGSAQKPVATAPNSIVEPPVAQPPASIPAPVADGNVKLVEQKGKTPAAKSATGKSDKEPAKKEANKPAENKIRKSVRVDAEKIDALMNQVGELVVDRSYFFQLFNEMRTMQQMLKEKVGVDQKEVKMLRAFSYRLGEAISALGRTSNELQEGVMKMRMMPISHIFKRYPRLVHDLTQNTDKKVKLEMYGEDTELDKMIVEELSDPLIHIIRNAIDHGIETAQERQSKGKSEVAKLVLDAYQESNHIVIEVLDDGRGINLEKIKEKAVNKGMYTADELSRMSNRDLVQIIMSPGFSTADKITGTSGRGVGMDVVKKNIEKLNGTLEIESKEGVGTQMRLKIPLTLAIIHALMIRVGNEMFTIPLANVDETVRINDDDTSVVEGVEVIYLRGTTLPIFHLSSIFNVEASHSQDKSFVVIVSTNGKRTGFVVDELLGQEEVVIKPLADYVQEKSGFSGATIIGDGRISLILDVYELVKMTATRLAAKHRMQTEKLKSGLHGQNNLRPLNS